MSRRRVKKRRTRDSKKADGLMEFFFVDEDPSQPRKDLVSRDELWRVLEWYHNQVVRQNTLPRMLWRWLRRWPSPVIDPFAMVRVARLRARLKKKEESSGQS